MDRTLIQERRHQVIEGMILAAIAVGARYGVIYVRKEYEDAVRRLEHALFQARRRGFLGEDIFGVEGLHFDIDIRLGAGAFVAGEKRAIMRAIEGEPAEPTLKAVSNTVRGLGGKPTLLNNVETFANLPLIIQRGGNWYAQQGSERSGGSKIFSVAGNLSYLAGDPFAAFPPRVDAIAYDKATGIWYASDTLQNSLATFNPFTGKLSTIGMLGIDASTRNGMDISPFSGIMYMGTPAASSDPQANLYTVNMLTGMATLVGQIDVPMANTLIRGLTVVPEPHVVALLALGAFALVCARRRQR